MYLKYPENYLQAQHEKVKKRKNEDTTTANGKKKFKHENEVSVTNGVIPEYVLNKEQKAKIEKDSVNKKLWDLCIEKLPEGEKVKIEKVFILFYQQ